MPQINLTDSFVKNVSTDGSRIEYAEAKAPGLALRVTAMGAKSWSLRYRRLDRQQVRITLGKYPDMSLKEARDRTFETRALVAKNVDPAAERKAKRHAAQRDQATTVLSVGTQYFEDAQRGYHRPNGRPKKQSTLDLEFSYFKRVVLPEVGNRPLKSIIRREAQAIIRSIEDNQSPSAARQCMAILRQIYAYSIRHGVVENNPFTSIQVARAASRDRVFDNRELRLIWVAIADPSAIKGLSLSHPMALSIRLAILTIQRAGEVLGIRMAELDLDAKTWTIPGSRTKNSRTHVVPLSDLAIEVLRCAIALNCNRGQSWDQSNGPLFPGRDPDVPMLRHSMTRAVTRMLATLSISDGTLHDLRRTGATNLTAERIGTPRLIVSQLLNHQSDTGGSSATTRIYDRNEYLPEKRASLQAWANHLRQISTGM